MKKPASQDARNGVPPLLLSNGKGVRAKELPRIRDLIPRQALSVWMAIEEREKHRKLLDQTTARMAGIRPGSPASRSASGEAVRDLPSSFHKILKLALKISVSNPGFSAQVVLCGNSESSEKLDQFLFLLSEVLLGHRALRRFGGGRNARRR